MTCTASGTSEVTIDCEGTGNTDDLYCSFNKGPLYLCMLIYTMYEQG